MDDESKPVAGGEVHAPHVRRANLGAKPGDVVVFTAAQNNTYVHPEFLESLESYCDKRSARLVVSPFTYNKSGFQNDSKDDADLWYDPRIAGYIVNESTQVSEDLVFCGELNILPTAVDPLSGLHSYTGRASGIIPHAKVRMQSLPRMKGEDARLLYTTGAVTMRNYIQKKAGQKAEFHHVYGALVVEFNKAGRWFARQLIANNAGEFCDLNTKYLPDGTTKESPVLAVNWGDVHAEKLDQNVMAGITDMVRVLKPEKQFVHDMTDFTARNHHNIKDPYFNAQSYYNSTDSVQANIQVSARFLYAVSKGRSAVYVVESNHDQAFDRWLREADGHNDPRNARYWHEYNAKVFRAIEDNRPEYNAYADAVQAEYSRMYHKRCDAAFLREDESVLIGPDRDIECSLHGHRGPNGTRGAANAFRTIGHKVNLGHAHTPSIIDGVYTAGVSASLDMGYNKGPSSWAHAHVLTYPTGKRAIVVMRGNQWRAEL